MSLRTMDRQLVIKQLNNAIQMQEDMKSDSLLALTYRDYNFDDFICRCEEVLHDNDYYQWWLNQLENPYMEVSDGIDYDFL